MGLKLKEVMKTLNNGSQVLMIIYAIYRFFVTSGLERTFLGIVVGLWVFGLVAGIVVYFYIIKKLQVTKKK